MKTANRNEVIKEVSKILIFIKRVPLDGISYTMNSKVLLSSIDVFLR